MKRLFIGCRVRILWSTYWPWLAGTEGVIVATAPNMPSRTGWLGDWTVVPDGWGGPEAVSKDGQVYTFNPTSEQLEPILPEGHQPSELSYEELLEDLREMVNA